MCCARRAMPDILVLDASAICKLVRREPESDEVEAKIRKHLGQGGAVWTDTIAAIEIVTCARKALDEGEGTLQGIEKAVRGALAVANLVVRDNDGAHGLTELIRLAQSTGLTGPDARYVELALGNRLLTFDAKQGQAAKKLGITLA